MSATYVGDELDHFALAHRWRAYLSDELRPWITGDVLEVGAGRGDKTAALMAGDERSWTCVEPDAALALQIQTGALPLAPTVVVGTLDDVSDAARFDTIVYLDVLEHIEDDEGELARAAAKLRPGGHLIVLAPAYQALFSPFDEGVGHFRRYRRSTLLKVAPPGVRLVETFYLDALGALLSAGNRLLLRTELPKRSHVLLWDRAFVPLSRAVVDRALRRRAGRSVIAVWQREPDAT